MSDKVYSPIRCNHVEGSLGVRGISAEVFSYRDGPSLYMFDEQGVRAWLNPTNAPRDEAKNLICSESEGTELRALILSLGYEAAKKDEVSSNTGIPLITTDSNYDSLIDTIGNEAPSVRVYTYSMLLSELRTLTFEQRYLRTLMNVSHELQKELSGVTCPYMYAERDVSGTHNLPSFRRLGNTSLESGRTFATPPESGHFVYEELYRLEYIRFGPVNWAMQLTSKGYSKLDELGKGLPNVTRNVFVIRAFDEALDNVLNPVFEEVGQRLKLNIKPVWGVEHIERIDERIFRQLRECVAVVLVVAPDRFNVGLEAGYALALGKPIVAIRPQPKDDDPEWKKKLPFDIATLNCYDFKHDNLDELKDKLEARLALAVPRVP